MLKAYLQATWYDARQSYLRQSRRRRSRSFVQGFLKLHWRLLDSTTASLAITDVSGVGQTMDTSTSTRDLTLRATGTGRGGGNFQARSLTSMIGISSTSVGIVVGTGTTAVTPTDFQLATLLVDGTASGTIEYFPSSGTDVTLVGSTGSFTLERLYRNSSGGTITINEVGVYATGRDATNGIVGFCIIRDLVSPGFAVTDGQYLRIVYTLSVTA